MIRTTVQMIIFQHKAFLGYCSEKMPDHFILWHISFRGDDELCQHVISKENMKLW